MTRPTTDGDTKAAIETLRDWVPQYEPNGALEALDLITTRLSEQEVELERAREAIRDYFRSNGPHTMSDGEWGSSVGYDTPLREYLESLGEKAPNHRDYPFDEHGNYRSALTPTTEDREGSAPG